MSLMMSLMMSLRMMNSKTINWTKGENEQKIKMLLLGKRVRTS